MSEVTGEIYEPEGPVTILVAGSIASQEDLIKMIRQAYGEPREDEEPQTPEDDPFWG